MYQPSRPFHHDLHKEYEEKVREEESLHKPPIPRTLGEYLTILGTTPSSFAHETHVPVDVIKRACSGKEVSVKHALMIHQKLQSEFYKDLKLEHIKGLNII
jgi:hypothetical protein